MNTVSVVIPTFNCAQRLLKALHSVAAQTIAHERIEVLIVDDGSTDDTSERVAAFVANTDLEVRYIHQANAGPAAARNHGLRLARGEAIAFLDDDDLWLPQKLEKQLPLLGGRTGLVYCDNVYVDATGKPLPGYPRPIPMIQGDAQLKLFCEFFLLTSAVCIQRACVERIGYFDEKLGVGEDYDYFLRLSASFDINYVAEKLLLRTVRPDSLSRRDYALDARIDIETLCGFCAAHPEFTARNKGEIRRRFAEYRYEFAYRLLDDGRRREALPQLLKSLLGCPSLKAAKACARLALPPRARPVFNHS